MIRARLKLIRQIVFAAILLGLFVCAAEVGVRVYEVSQGTPICSTANPECLVDPTQLTIPSWLTNLELKPHASCQVKCRDSRRTVAITTNSLGFRGAEVAIPKPENSYRILLLGDETTFAPETTEENHFVSQLQQMLQQQTRMSIEVVNASIPGACPLTEYVLFKQKLIALQPDLILLHFDWSDVADDRQLRRRTRSDAQGTPLSCPHASLQNSAKKPNPVSQLREHFRLVDWGMTAAGKQWKQQIFQQAASSREIGTNMYAWLRSEHPENDITVTNAFQPISDVARMMQGTGFQLAILTSPKPWQVSARCSNGAGVRVKSGVSPDAYYPNRAPFDALANYVGEWQLPFIDLSEPLLDSNSPESNYLKYAPRWSVAGHEHVAEFVARFLVEKVPGPWNSRYFQRTEGPIGQSPMHDGGVQRARFAEAQR